ncbi:hypothetical protein [Colwellia sp. MEBiC06753]
MSGTTMVVLIVLISVGFGVIYDMYQKHLKFKEKTMHINQKSTEHQQELTAEISALKERVAVLEKIVTDEGYSVDQEIRKL